MVSQSSRSLEKAHSPLPSSVSADQGHLSHHGLVTTPNRKQKMNLVHLLSNSTVVNGSIDKTISGIVLYFFAKSIVATTGGPIPEIIIEKYEKY